VGSSRIVTLAVSCWTLTAKAGVVRRNHMQTSAAEKKPSATSADEDEEKAHPNVEAWGARNLFCCQPHSFILMRLSNENKQNECLHVLYSARQPSGNDLGVIVKRSLAVVWRI